MKKLLLLLLAVFTIGFGAEATHIIGGDIQYEYKRNVGASEVYEVTLRVYRDCNGARLLDAEDIRVSSSCFPTFFVNANAQQVPGGGIYADPVTYEDCTVPGVARCVKITTYITEVTVPSKCSDITFSWEICCRPGGISSITNSGGVGFYFEATLNNIQSPNSSPTFLSEPAKTFCVGNNFNWAQNIAEPDGDSISFELISAREDNATTSVPYAPGYSATTPLTNAPGTALTINPKTGNLNFTTGAVEDVVIAVRVNEYRLDTVYYQWQKVGSSNRELYTSILGSCNKTARDSVKLDVSYPEYYIDAATGRYTSDYNCLDSSVTLKFTVKLDCSTISPDGTDFRLTSVNGQPIPIKSLNTVCDINNETDSLIVKLHKPLAINGDYYLYSKIGNDGNTLFNKCGFPMKEFDTLQLRVTGCYNNVIDMRNVSIVDDKHPRIEWYLDTVGTPTSPYPTWVVDEYRVFRSDDNGATYNFLTSINNYKRMWFEDLSVSPQDVDNQHYKYRVELIINGLSSSTTRSINSIWLRTASGQPLEPQDNLMWSHYPAWPNPEFTLYLGQRDSSGNWNDTIHVPTNAQLNPTTDSTYEMVNKDLKPGEYRVCVLAEYPGGSGPFEAWSNCIPFSIPEPTPPPVDTPLTVIVPNVLTPNGDGLNDIFIVQNLETWETQRSIKIFNRWGKLVYESDFYKNTEPWLGTDQSGKILSDGVYFYVFDIYDALSGKRDELKGNITIMGSAN